MTKSEYKVKLNLDKQTNKPGFKPEGFAGPEGMGGMGRVARGYKTFNTEKSASLNFTLNLIDALSMYFSCKYTVCICILFYQLKVECRKFCIFPLVQ